jgi:hypothetical protein
MTTADVDRFERVRAQLTQLHLEIAVLSKSKPDNLINKFKLNFINEKLAQANSILVEKFRPFRDFTTFEENALPSNSDVTLVLSQYLECLEAWRCANIYQSDYRWQWKLDGTEEVKTDAPTRFRAGKDDED